jgi:hypothetical protein
VLETARACGVVEALRRHGVPKGTLYKWVARAYLEEGGGAMASVPALRGPYRVAARLHGRHRDPWDMRAPIARNPPRFVPASEVCGEGIFLRFDEGRLGTWCEPGPSTRTRSGAPTRPGAGGAA